MYHIHKEISQIYPWMCVKEWKSYQATHAYTWNISFMSSNPGDTNSFQLMVPQSLKWLYSFAHKTFISKKKNTSSKKYILTLLSD